MGDVLPTEEDVERAPIVDVLTMLDHEVNVLRGKVALRLA